MNVEARVKGVHQRPRQASPRLRRPPARHLASHPGGIGTDTRWGLGAEATRFVASLSTFWLLSRTLELDGYGAYAAISGLVTTITMLCNNWVGQWLMEAIVRDAGATSRSVRRATSMMMILGLAAVGLGVALRPVLLPSITMLVLGPFLVGEVLNASITGLCIASVSATTGYVASAKLSILAMLSKPIVVVALYLAGNLTLKSVVVGILVANLVAAPLALVITIRITNHALGLSRFGWSSLSQALPYAATNLAFAMQEEFDKPLMLRLGVSADVGPYAAAYRIVQIAMVPIKGVVGATHVRFLETGTERGRNAVISLARFLTLRTTAGAAAIVGVVLAARPLLPAVLGKEFEAALPMLTALTPVVVLRAMSWFPLNGLMALGMQRARIIVLALSSITNLGTNLILIPIISWRGAVIATIGSEVVFVTLAWVLLYTSAPNVGPDAPSTRSSKQGGSQQ